MKLSYFIARRITREHRESFSSTIHKIAVFSIGFGLAASIIAFLILKGFQETVKNKIFNFSGHLLVTRVSMSNSPEETPMDYNLDLYRNYRQFPHVTHVQEFATKAGLIKTDDDVLGVVLKGVGRTFDVNAFKENIVEGSFIQLPDSGYSNEILISRNIANKLKVNLHDKILLHFFQDPPRSRRLTVSGIYETNLSEYFDGKFIIGDIRLIQRLNEWSDSIAGGLEIFVDHADHVEDARQALWDSIDANIDTYLKVERISDRYMQVFEWLNLLSRQVNILLGLILIVVCINMASIVLILVMERTQMIGLLKALGATNRLIRSIFILNGVNLIMRGLLFGNLLGLGLCYLQYRFNFIKLNAQDYYMSVVPISWHWEIVALLNLLIFSIVTLILLIPATVITRINPIKAIRFD